MVETSTTNRFVSALSPESEQEHSGQNVLLVDDNETLLAVLRETLTGAGFNVSAVASAKEALAKLEQDPPDVIVCDVMMPEMDGFQFHEQVLARSEWVDIPFIFLTALSSPEEVRYGKARGCDEYLTKPFDPGELIAVVQGKVNLADQRKRLSDNRILDYRRRIIQTLSHEFRTPLVAINTGSELLLDKYDGLDETRVQNLLESIQRGGRRLQRLVDDFMLVQQIDAGVAESAQRRLRHKAQLAEIAETAVESFKDWNAGYSGQITLVCDPEIESAGWIEGLDAQVIEAVKRVLNNAEKFGGETSPIEISVTLSTDASGAKSYGSIQVRDHGPGLPEESQKQICSLFTQVDRERLEQQGCGLGLTIANYFTRLNGGELLFHTPKTGKGLIVELKFPLSS